MALVLTDMSVQFFVNDKRALNNSTFTGIVNGTSREASLSLKFFQGESANSLNSDCKIAVTVYDSNNKLVDIGFDSSLDKLRGRFLFNGTYKINVEVVDSTQTLEEQVSNKLKDSITITITGCYSTLSSFEPSIVDKNSGIEITNGIVFSNGETIIPDFDQELPFDFELNEYSLLRNGLAISYSPYGDRTISDDGDYKLTIVVKRRGLELSGDIMVKTFTRSFKIQKSFINKITEDDIFVYNALDNTAITNGYTYVDKDVVIDWDLNDSIEVNSVTLLYYDHAKLRHVTEAADGTITVDANFSQEILGDFDRGSTYLSSYGVYELRLVLQEYENNKNRFTLTRYFVIEGDVIRLDSSKIKCYDANNMQEMGTTNDILTTDQVIPAIVYSEDLDDAIEVDVIAEYNGKVMEPGSFTNGETILSTPGIYRFKGRVFEIGTPDNEKDRYTRTFTFIVVEPPISLGNIDPILINVETGLEVVNGEVFNYRDPAVDGEYKFTVNKIKNVNIQYYYVYYSSSGSKKETALAPINDDNPMSVYEIGNYVVRLKVYDTTVNPVSGDLLYPDNVLEKTYVFSILSDSMSTNDPNKLVYINGQLLDAFKANPIWECLSPDSEETQFSVIKPGNYHVLIVNKNQHNFKYSINEYSFTVIEPDFQQKAIISSDPPPQYSVKESFKVYITYPSSAIDQLKFYKDANINPDAWIAYPDKGITCTEPCKIYARYKDSATQNWVETTESDAFYPGPKIDRSPVILTEDDILGIVHEGRYFVACPDIKRKMDMTYTAYIKKPGSDKFEKCELAEMFNEEGTYYFKVVAVNNINGNKGESPEIKFIIDHTKPPVPSMTVTSTVEGVMKDNARVTGTVSVEINNMDHSKYRYELYVNDRLHFKTTNTNSNVNIPRISRDGNYNMTLVSIDKSSERRSMSYFNFTISNSKINVTGAPIKPHRYYIKDGNFYFKNDIKPYDGELLIRCADSNWKPTGDVGIYRDGLVVNKYLELSKSLQQLEYSIDNIEFDLTSNMASTKALVTLKDDLYYKLLRLVVETSALKNQVNNMYDYVSKVEVPKLDELLSVVIGDDPIYKELLTYNQELGTLSGKLLTNFKNSFNTIISNLQNNADTIGELHYKAKIYDAIKRK